MFLNEIVRPEPGQAAWLSHAAVKPVPTSYRVAGDRQRTRDKRQIDAGPARSKPDSPGAKCVRSRRRPQGPKQTSSQGTWRARGLVGVSGISLPDAGPLKRLARERWLSRPCKQH